MSDFAYRFATPEDTQFIERSWHESLWKTTYMGHKDLQWDDYKSGQDLLIKRILSKVRPVALCYKPTPDLLLGYIVVENDTLHWCYVKNIYRRQHVATALLKTFPQVKQYSQKVRRNGAKWLSHINLKYNPYTLMELPCPIP